jgi:hemolysin D
MNRLIARLDRHDDAALQRAFMPAAVEIVETPPNPLGRWIIGSITALTGIAIIWAYIGEVDIVAVAEGRVIPSARVKLVQPLESGVIRAIHVRDGQLVRAGDPLVDFDPTTSDAELTRLTAELLVQRLDAARQRALLRATESSDAVAAEGRLELPEGTPPGMAAVQTALLKDKLDEHRARLFAADRQIAQKEADRAAVQSAITRLDRALPLLRERVTARRTLAEREVGSRITWLEVQQQLVEAEQDLVTQRARLTEATAAIAAIEAARRQSMSEFRRIAGEALALAEQRAASLAQEARKAQQRLGLQRLVAVEDSIVQQLGIHTVGGVVTPAQTLMTLVPAGDCQPPSSAPQVPPTALDARGCAAPPVEIEATLPNKDVGFVQPGQAVAVKVQTFIFTRYGWVPGWVTQVSADALAPDGRGTSDGGRPGRAVAEDPSPYVVRIALARTWMDIDGRRVDLAPGMRVTAEIAAGTRTVMDFLLSPLARSVKEAARER